MKISFDKIKDKVQILAPASKCNEFDKIIDLSSQLFKKYSINYSVSDGLISDKGLPFYSNSLKYRYDDFKSALEDEEVKVLWCLRGGYGSSEICFKLIEEHYKLKSPKILIGFSDITSLHLLFNNQFNLPSIHGSMLASLDTKDGTENVEKIFTMFKETSKSYRMSQLNNIKYDKIESQVVGGNLTVLCSNIGTPILDDAFFDNKILFLEDIGETSYKIMRALMHIFHSGILSKITAIIFGDFTKSDTDYKNTILEFITNYCKGIPAFSLENIGHGDINEPLILGVLAKIENDVLTINNPFEFIN